MGFFASTDKVVELGNGNTVTLHKVTFGGYQEAQSKAMRISGEGLQLDWPKLRIEVLKRSVVAWDGPGFDGQLPTAENIERLPVEVGNKLAEEAMSLATIGDEAGN